MNRQTPSQAGRARSDDLAVLKAVLDGIDDIIYVADPETYELLHVNETFERSWGSDVLGKKCHTVLQDRDDPCPFCTNDKIFGDNLGMKHVWEFQNEVTRRWYRCDDKAIRWTDGRMVRFEIAADITEKKRIEAELRVKDAFFEESLAALSTADSQGVINLVNDGFVQLWRYESKKAALGNSVGDFFADPQDAAAVLEALNTIGKWEGEFLARRQDGEQFISRGYATAIRGADGDIAGYQSTCIDVTELRENERRLTELSEALARSNRELEQFAYVASHDLQEPLRMVASYTELLARRYEGKLDDKADMYIGYAVDGARRMQGLINDLLTFSRAGTRARLPEAVDCGAVVAEVLGGLERSIEDSAADIIVGELPTIMADRTQLGQVFQNLISNAIKFRSSDTPRVEVTAARRDEMWEITVADNGVGIDPRYFDRIFIIFQRLHERDRYPGSGIGLSIVKKIVERHGGRIRIESVSGEGARFIFAMPAAGGAVRPDHG